MHGAVTQKCGSLLLVNTPAAGSFTMKHPGSFAPPTQPQNILAALPSPQTPWQFYPSPKNTAEALPPKTTWQLYPQNTLAALISF